MVGPLVRGKELDFSVHAPTDPLEVQTDPTKLRQILWNLLSNALNYTDRGEVALTVNANGEDILLEVRDTGAGIPAEEMDHVFEPFRRADREAKQRNGTRDGPECRETPERTDGGSIRVESAVG